MKTIEITCNSSGRMNYTITKNDRFKYATYKDIIDDVINTANDKIVTKIVDGNIYFRNSYVTVVIKNYRNNKDITLDQVIDRVKKINILEKKKRIRNKKIKRIRTLAGVTIISLGVIFSSTLINKIEINSYKDNSSYHHNLNQETINDTEIVKVIEEELEEAIPEKDYGEIIELNVESRTCSDKYNDTKQTYYEKISKISNNYGIDPRIMLAIATQETGEHDINTNAPALGLMQIELSVWDGEELSAYNFSEGRYEKIKITEEKLKDIDFNIRVACMYFQKCLKDSNYDLNIAIQMYNFGYGNIEKTFRMYHNDGDMQLPDALKHYSDDWLEYRDYINVGDKEYLEHIISYIEDLECIECHNDNGNTFIYTYKTNSLGHKI